MSLLSPLDWSIIVFYFIAVFGVAFWSTQLGSNVLAEFQRLFFGGA